jgi:hypothetical protein
MRRGGRRLLLWNEWWERIDGLMARRRYPWRRIENGTPGAGWKPALRKSAKCTDSWKPAMGKRPRKLRFGEAVAECCCGTKFGSESMDSWRGGAIIGGELRIVPPGAGWKPALRKSA